MRTSGPALASTVESVSTEIVGAASGEGPVRAAEEPPEHDDDNAPLDQSAERPCLRPEHESRPSFGPEVVIASRGIVPLVILEEEEGENAQKTALCDSLPPIVSHPAPRPPRRRLAFTLTAVAVALAVSATAALSVRARFSASAASVGHRPNAAESLPPAAGQPLLPPAASLSADARRQIRP